MSSKNIGISLTNDFETVPLLFEKNTQINVFASKNNKSVEETLAHYKYAKLLESTLANYGDSLNQPLGEFLLSLKGAGDEYYKRFLNRYGDLEYSKFSLADSKFHDLKGVYAYFQRDRLMYIGRCRASM